MSTVSKLNTDSKGFETSPYIDYGSSVTPSDTSNTPFPFKVLVVSTAGTVTWLNFNKESQTFNCAVPGQPYFIRGVRILSTGTTATGIYIGGGQ